MPDKTIILEVLGANGGQMCPRDLRDECARRGVDKREFAIAMQSLLSWDEVGIGPKLTIALPETAGVTFNHY
jgi:hypothetical protein